MGRLYAPTPFRSKTAALLTANAPRSDEAYAPGRNGGAAALFYGGNRIVVDAFRNMQFGSQFSVSLFFKRIGGERNYQGIVSNGYGSNGAWLAARSIAISIWL